MRLVSEIELRARSLEKFSTLITSQDGRLSWTTSRTLSVDVRHGVLFTLRSGLRTTAIALSLTSLRFETESLRMR